MIERPHRDWKSPVENLERFVLRHLGTPAKQTEEEFMRAFTGETIGGGVAAGSFVYNPETREAMFAIATTGVPDGIGQVNVRSDPIEEA